MHLERIMKKILLFILLTIFVTTNLLGNSNDFKLLEECSSETADLKHINELLRAGADVNYKYENDLTPLFAVLCTEKPNAAIVTTLIKAGADVNFRCDGASPLSYAIFTEKPIETIKVLIEAGADVNFEYEGISLLSYVIFAEKPNIDIIKTLIQAGADVNYKYDGLNLLLHLLSEEEPNIKIITIMLNAGADYNYDCGNGLTPFLYALNSNNDEIIKAFINEGADFDMILIPNKGIMILRTEVTQAIWGSISDRYQECIDENNLNLPMNSISWYDAVVFCNDLSRRFGLAEVYTISGKNVAQNVSANGFRLPTEEEWEYAAKGGKNYIYSGSNNIDEIAWYSSNSSGKPHQVALKKANGYGIYDMTGNVQEWCWNVNSNNGNNRSIRGGGWNNIADNCKVSGRDWLDYRNKSHDVGFRIVRTEK